MTTTFERLAEGKLRGYYPDLYPRLCCNLSGACIYSSTGIPPLVPIHLFKRFEVSSFCWLCCKLSSTWWRCRKEGKGYRLCSPPSGSVLHPTSHRWLYSLHAISFFIGIHESVVKSFFFLLMLAAFCFE